MATKTLALLLLCLASASIAAAAAEGWEAEAMADVLLQVQLDVRSGNESERPPFWAGKNGDNMRTGASAFVAPSHIEAEPTWRWHEPGTWTTHVVRAAPLIDGDMNIYVATTSGKLLKFSPSGEVLWSVEKPRIPDVPALYDGRVFAATKWGEVFALDAATGAQVWHASVSDGIAEDTWSVTAAEGVVVVCAEALHQHNRTNNWLVALSARDGRELWRFHPESAVYNFLAAVHEGHLYFSDSVGTTYKLRLGDGAVIWMRRGCKGAELPGFTTGGTVMGPDGTLFTTSNLKLNEMFNTTGRVRALRPEDGELLWSTDLPYLANNAPAIGHLTPGGVLSVVVGIGDNPAFPVLPGQPQPGVLKVGQVVALDAASGTSRWVHTMPLWHDSAAGDTIWPVHVCLPDSFSNPTIGGDGTIYIGFEDGHLYALREAGEDSTPPEVNVTSFDAKAAFQGSAGIAPGMLVAMPCNGVLVWRS